VRCAGRVAAVRAEPDEDAERVTELLPGEPVEVVARREGWVRIRTAYDYPGWVRAGELEPGDGSLPGPSGGDPLEEARAYRGAPYLWGGLTLSGIDCSGLVHMAYRRLGRLVPRDAWQQAEAGAPLADPDPGAVAVYAEPEQRPDHVAFWLGAGRILHATGRDGLGVVEEDEPAPLAARRVGFVRFEPRDSG